MIELCFVHKTTTNQNDGMAMVRDGTAGENVRRETESPENKRITSVSSVYVFLH